MAAQFIVTSTNDINHGTCGSDCSLRDAINAANGLPGTDTIIFAIPGAGTHTTQPGYAGTPLIVLDGSQSGATPAGLIISGGNSTVRGLVVNNHVGAGILLAGSGNNIIQGNYIGTDTTGARQPRRNLYSQFQRQRHWWDDAGCAQSNLWQQR